MSPRTALPPPPKAPPPPPVAAPAQALPAGPFLRNVRSLFVGSVGSGAVRAARSVVLSRLLGPSAYGNLDLAVFYSRTLAGLARLGLADATVRFGAALPAREARSFSRRVATLVVLAAGIAAPIGAMLAAPALGQAGPRADLVAAAAFAAVPALALADVARALFVARQNFATPAAIGFATGIAAFALEVLAVVAGLGIPGILVASLVAALGALALYTRALPRLDRGGEGPPATAPRAAAVVRYAAARFVLGALTVITWTRFEVVFLGTFWSSSEVAFFALPFGIVGAALELVPGSISAVLPAAYPERRAQGGVAAATDLYRRAFFLMAAVGLPVAAAGAVLAEPLFPAVFTERFLPSVPVVRVLVVGSVLSMIASAASHLLLSSSKAPWALLVAASGAAVNLTLDFRWIPQTGAVGAAWANATAQVFESAIAIGAVALLFGARAPLGRVLRLLPPLAACVGVGLLDVSAFGENPWLCGGVALPSMAAAYVGVGRWTRAFSGRDREDFRALLSLSRARP